MMGRRVMSGANSRAGLSRLRTVFCRRRGKISLSPSAAFILTRSSCSSGVNSSPASTPTSSGSSLTFGCRSLDIGTSKVLREGTTMPSCCTGVGLSTFAVVRLLEVLLLLRSTAIFALLLLCSETAGGELPLWNGLSLLKGLSSNFGRVCVWGSAGFSTFTVGVTWLFRLFRTEGRIASRSGSSSVSDRRGCFIVLLRVLGVGGWGVTDSDGSLVDRRDDLRVDLADATGGAIDSTSSSSSSPSTVPSWLLGMSVIPLLVRLTLARAARSLPVLGATS